VSVTAQGPSIFAGSTMGWDDVDRAWAMADSMLGGMFTSNAYAATTTVNGVNNNEATKNNISIGLVETVKKNFMGIRYPKGKEEKKTGIGRNDKGEIVYIDCSHLVYEAHKALNVSSTYSPSGNFANNSHYRSLTASEKPQKDDVMLFPGHMGFYDPNPPITGYTVLGATSSGGVRYGDPSWFGDPTYYRYVP